MPDFPSTMHWATFNDTFKWQTTPTINFIPYILCGYTWILDAKAQPAKGQISTDRPVYTDDDAGCCQNVYVRHKIVYVQGSGPK